jgi:hypothetical protein
LAFGQPAPTDPQPTPIDPQPAPVEPAPAPAPEPSASPAPTAPPPATTAPATQQPSSYSALAAQAGPPPSTHGSLEQRLDEKAFIPVLSLGLVAAGGGDTEFECEASIGSCSGFSGNDYDDASTFVIGADFLFKIVPKFRLGLGLMWIPTPSYDFEGSSDETDSGHEFAAVVVGEGVFPVADNVGIYARGQAGVMALVAGNDHADDIDNIKDLCTATVSPDTTCDVSEGPFFGSTFGIGGGVMLLVGDSVSLRAGLLLQFYNTQYLSYKLSGGGASVEQTGRASGNRGILMVGAEF